MKTESQQREEICRIAKSIFDRGLTHGSTGNVSAKLEDGWLITPTGSSLGNLDPARLSKLVFASEPNVDPRLIALPGVITLPHMGSATVEGRALAGERVIANIRFWADGHRPPDQVLSGWD